MVKMFISYCQKDKIHADYIDLYFKNKEIIIHRDIRDIQNWKSIKEYMQTIRDMDYAILIISDHYLKSFNCMYEVIELLKDKHYEKKIFPVVVETTIYQPQGRIPYIQYWEEKYRELENKLRSLGVVNLGSLTDDLKRIQSITSTMSEFLELVSDMNNPDVLDVNIAIENKLKEHGLLKEENVVTQNNIANDTFSALNIPKINDNTEPTDLDKNNFMAESFRKINILLGQLCSQLQSENNSIQIQIEQIDIKTVIYKFYKNGTQVRGLKLFLGNYFGGKENNIGISCDNYSFGSNNSFNGMFSFKFENGEMYLFSTFSASFEQRIMSINEATKEIWTSYIQQYI